MREKFAFKLLRVNILFTWVILFGITLNNYGQIFSSVESDKETGAEMAAQVKSQIGLYELPTTNSPYI